jgi:hypothetical protein
MEGFGKNAYRRGGCGAAGELKSVCASELELRDCFALGGPDDSENRSKDDVVSRDCVGDGSVVDCWIF